MSQFSYDGSSVRRCRPISERRVERHARRTEDPSYDIQTSLRQAGDFVRLESGHRRQKLKSFPHETGQNARLTNQKWHCPMQKKSYQSGFSLIELLVVIAIIGALVALLLPAVQSAREAARRSSCKNNLKQIGLSLHNYHDIHDLFPPGYVGDPHVTTPGYGMWAWSTALLPFLDQEPLYNRLLQPISKLPSQSYDKFPAEMRTTQAVWKCPSDVAPDANDAPNRLIKTDANPNGIAVATSNYVGVNNAWGLLNSNVAAPVLSDATTYPAGTFYKNSSIGFRDMRDGTSNIVVVGERKWTSSDSSPYQFKSAVMFMVNAASPGDAAQHVPGTSTGSDSGLVFSLGATITRINDKGPDAQINDVCRQSFSSQHTGGAHFLMGDGAARFISETIDHKISPPTVTSGAMIDSTMEYLVGIRDDNIVDSF